MKILFIGNSHTFFNDMPYMLKYLSANAPLPFEFEPVMLAHGGKSFEFHLGEPEVRFNLKYGGYDFVILQQVAHVFPGEEVLMRDGKELVEMVQKSDSKPVLFMTWAHKSSPEKQAKVTSAYQELAQATSCILAPIGLAWQYIIETHPDIELFDPDGGHASFAGHYLTSCVLYATLFGASPVGMPPEVRFGDEVLGSVTPEVALILQKAAFLQI